jgi:hypothetical protein
LFPAHQCCTRRPSPATCGSYPARETVSSRRWWAATALTCA